MADAPDHRPSGLRIATISGVPVYIGWSWFALAAVITFFFGTRLSETSSLGYVIGLAYALLLLVAVLIHEGAHAVSARSLGVPVHRVVADFLGGHTAFDGRGMTPSRAAFIAGAGPVSNLALGLAAWLTLQTMGTSSTSVTALVLMGVAWINLLLAAFNLVPALPLDGGQLLESAVWGATGRRSAGMIVSGWAGRVLTLVVAWWVLLRPLMAGRSPDTIQLIWGVLIGAVIWRGATAAINRGKMLALFEGITLQSVAVPVVTLPLTTPLSSATTQPAAVVALDEAGRPSLVLLGAGAGAGPGSADLPPQAPLSAAVTRFPDAAVIEARPDDPVELALNAIGTTQWGAVVLTRDGVAWGLTDVQRIEGAARTRR